MLLQINPRSSFSLKYHPLQHAGSVKTFQTRVKHINGLANKSESKKYSVRCSSESSFFLTNKIGHSEDLVINRNHKLLSKSTVALAAQDGYSSESELVSTSFMQVLNKKCDAFYRLTRPYSCVSIIAALLSVSLLPLQNPADFTPKLIIEAFKCMVPAIMMNNYANAINQLADVHIDKAVAMGIMLRSPPLVIGFIIWCIVGGAYSIDLPPLLRWKGNPLMAAVTIISMNGLLLLFPFFIHFQKIVLGNPVSFTKPVLFTAAYMVIWNAAIAFVKDIPDVEGDKAFGLRTLPIIIGKEKVFSIAVNMMLMAYGGAVLVGAFSPSVLCKLVTMIGHSALAFVLWRQAKTIDLSHNKSVQSFYLFIWKLYYVEFLFVHFLR
ncbi:homogentisate geranylgeranyltransferase [Citrus sinensis]|uniref:Homogentisate phytyltransferase 1 n=1 Tax=Citrus sinensis TaxID=2711 RepID=A0ACB8HTQ2_CITSI|nr:coumarin 8-geranyltransferase 1b, chloroplastic-like isoform X3 [Citrus sinensis]KAH9646906.1 homogentisate geranylgeranyltransferase [Citrus sinensis]KAH9677676.1 putative homogentisate phytyltransferase 1 [Citrus sinensis]